MRESLPLLNGEDEEPVNVVNKCGQGKQIYKHYKTGDLCIFISNVRKEEECNTVDDTGCYIGFISQTNAIH